MFRHVNQPVSFLPKSSVTDIAPKVFSVDSLVMEQNLLLVHIKNVLALEDDNIDFNFQSVKINEENSDSEINSKWQ